MQLWTAFTIGLVGSLHCVGMCGPIAMALPQNWSGRMALLTSRVVYNMGRVLTYSLMGLVWGIVGQGINMAGYQQGLSIALGILLLAGILFSLNLENRFISLPPVDRMMTWLRKALGKQMRQSSQGSMLIIGMLNGFLPCGFVYLALAGAISTGWAWEGAAYMALFGLGTFPLMLATSLAGSLFSPRIRQKIRPFMMSVAFLFAALFILRGLNLGIPYVSPEIAGQQTEAPVCH